MEGRSGGIMISLNFWILFYFLIGGVILYYSRYQPFPEIGGRFAFLIIFFGIIFTIASTAPRETLEELPALITVIIGSFGIIIGVRHMVITKQDVILAPFGGLLLCIGAIDLLTVDWVNSSMNEQIMSFIIASIIVMLEIYLAFRGLVVGVPGISWSKSGLRQIKRGLIYGKNGAIEHFKKSWDMNDPWLNTMSHAALFLIYEKIGDEEKGSEHLLELEKDGGWSALDESWTEIIKNSLNEISL